MKKNYIPLRPQGRKVYTPYVPQERPTTGGKKYVPLKPSGTKEYVPYVPTGKTSKYVPYNRSTGRFEKIEFPESSFPAENRGVYLYSTSTRPIGPEIIHPPYNYYPHPSDYCGFVSETTITFRHEEITKGEVRKIEILFKGEDWSPRLCMSAELDSDTNGGHLSTLTKIIISGNPSARDMYPNQGKGIHNVHPAWGAPVDTNRFDNITVRAVDKPVNIRGVTIVLNQELIVNNYILPYRNGIIIAPYKKDLDLTRIIRKSRLAEIKRYCSQRPLPRILEVAALDIGQAWDPKYSPWRFDTNANEPYAWCSEYFTWALNVATDGRVDIHTGNQNYVTDDIAQFFQENYRYYTAKDFPYEELGRKIKPGFYTKVGRSSHSTLFIGWCDEKGNPTDFNPNPPKPDGLNYFMAIGGNQSRASRGSQKLNVVSINKYSIAKYPPAKSVSKDDWARIIWVDNERFLGVNVNGNSWETNLDGFGNTHNFPMSMKNTYKPLFIRRGEQVDLRPVWKLVGDHYVLENEGIIYRRFR